MKKITDQKGIALLTVLWVLTILMVIAFSFSYLTRTEILSTRTFKEGAENRLLAEAGIERGIMELFYRQKMRTAVIENLAEGGEVWKTDGRPYSSPLGEGNYLVRIFDESAKININSPQSGVLIKNLLEKMDIKDIDVETIVDSMLDWRDKDDLHRLHGAESDYYQSLAQPYKAKNGDFDTPEELLLVKGMTRELLYGNGRRKGIIDFLTVQATGNININSAPKEVLLAVPNMTAEMADQIIAQRQIKELDGQALAAIFGNQLALIQPFINFGQGTTIFTLEATGYQKTAKNAYGIRATVALLGNDRYRYLYYKTPVTLKGEEAASP